MKSIGTLILLTTACTFAFPLSRTLGQGVLDKTTFGQSQNDARDLANSLVPGPKRYDKGEKKEQINAAELKSKKITDTTFGGSLLNMGIVGAEPKLDEQKLRGAAIENDSSASKEARAAVAKESKQTGQSEKQQSTFSNLSETATLTDEVEQTEPEARSQSKTSNSTAISPDSEAQDKQQRSTSSASTEEKSSATSTDKTSATAKPDGGANH
jgi:hypothetical protein